MSDENQVVVDLLAEDLRAKLEAAHGEVMAVRTRAGVVAFRVFKKPEYDRFMRLNTAESTRPQALETLVKSCVVHPDLATFTAWVDKYPGIILTCGNPVLEFGGVNVEAEQKKYGSA